MSVHYKHITNVHTYKDIFKNSSLFQIVSIFNMNKMVWRINLQASMYNQPPSHAVGHCSNMSSDHNSAPYRSTELCGHGVGDNNHLQHK